MTGPDKADIAGLAAQIARQFSTPGGGAGANAKNNLLAIPFSAPPGDQRAKGMADAVFGQLFGKVAIAQHGHVRLSTDSSLPADPAAAGERGRADHSTYVVYGAVENQSLNVKVIESEDGSVEWSKSYPLEGADTARIAAEVQENIPEDKRSQGIGRSSDPLARPGDDRDRWGRAAHLARTSRMAAAISVACVSRAKCPVSKNRTTA